MKPWRDIYGKRIEKMVWLGSYLDHIEIEGGIRMKMASPVRVDITYGQQNDTLPNCVLAEHLNTESPTLCKTRVQHTKRPVLRIGANTGDPQLIYWCETKKRLRFKTFRKMRVVFDSGNIEPGMRLVNPDKLEELIP